MALAPLTGFEKKTVVNIATLAVSNDENTTLTAYALGSCLCVAIYDPVAKAGGLLHAMLPDSTIDPGKALSHPGMFVDTGVGALFRAAYELRAEKHRVIITVAGGAEILDTSGCFNVGTRNAQAFEKLLQLHGLRVHAQQTGGVANRTLYLNLGNGEVRVKLSGQTAETILCKSSTTT